MSDDFLHLLVLVGVIYLVELVSILPEPRRLLVQLLGRRFALTGSGFVLRNPLPWSLAFGVEGFRLIFSDEGVAAYQPHRPSPRRPPGWGHRYVRYDAIQHTEVQGADLLVNGQLFLRHASEPAARESAARLRELARLPHAARRVVIDGFYARDLDLIAVEARRGQVLRQTLALRVTSTLLFFHIAATLTLFVTTEWAVPRWSRFVLGFLVLMAAVVWQFAAAHRALYPEARGDRWLKSFVLAANFPSACRAGEAVGREAFAGFHRLAVLRTLVDDRAFRTLARAELLALRHPSPWEAEPPDTGARACLAAHRELALERLTSMLEAAGVDVARLTAPPERSSPVSFGYCPRCQTEYLGPAATCPECAVAVVSFSASA